MSQTLASDDALALGKNASCQKMLSKRGSCFPEPERVVYSEKLIKINRKRKEQERVLLITDKAIYNLLPSDYSKCKRRIDLESIESVTISEISSEFVLHIPQEYDYRFKSENKERLTVVLSCCYVERNGFNKELVINKVSQSSLLSVTVTKDANANSKDIISTREQRYKRYKELLEFELTGSDEEDANDMAQAAAISSLQSNSVKSEDFELLKVIGRGSFGKVMQVRKKDDGEILAMKILKKRAIVARNQVQHTKSERSILQQLQHPFLMRLRYAFQTNEKLYFVLDYYRGGELFFHLKKKRRFTESEAQIFVSEVALAVGHLHAIDVIYRDLKPENILLDREGHICLTDFGLSKQQNINNWQLAHTFCGTPEYLAPEIVTNVGHSKAVDWWSLGILLYELTIGIPPFYSMNVNEMYKKIQCAPLQFPPQSTPCCKSLISLLLEREPKYRLGSGAHDVEEIKRHPFFRNIDWIALYKKEIEPIYKPNVKNDTDTSNFDKQFTQEPVMKSYEAKINIMTAASAANAHDKSSVNNKKDSNPFDDFSFVAIPQDDDDDDDDDD